MMDSIASALHGECSAAPFAPARCGRSAQQSPIDAAPGAQLRRLPAWLLCGAGRFLNSLHSQPPQVLLRSVQVMADALRLSVFLGVVPVGIVQIIRIIDVAVVAVPGQVGL